MKYKNKIRTKPVNWETEYCKTVLWGKKPHKYSILASKLISNGKVLDIGCGEGHDCLYFVLKDYEVTGLDISNIAIKRLILKAEQNNLKIKTLVKDIRNYIINDKYDIIISYGTLQFLGKKFMKFITSMKQHTINEGIHAFYIFGNKGDFYDIAKDKFWFPSLKELKKLYSDWTILKLETKNTTLLIKGDNGELLYNLMYKILLKK